MDKLTDIRLSLNDELAGEVEAGDPAPPQDAAPDGEKTSEYTHPEDTLEIRGSVVSVGNPGGSRPDKRFGSSFDYKI